MNPNPPTDAAFKLAEWFFDGYGLNHNAQVDRAAVITALAKRIDEQLLLPEKHAALLLAQGVVDELYRWTTSTDGLVRAINDLGEALSKIRKTTDCPPQ